MVETLVHLPSWSMLLFFLVLFFSFLLLFSFQISAHSLSVVLPHPLATSAPRDAPASSAVVRCSCWCFLCPPRSAKLARNETLVCSLRQRSGGPVNTHMHTHTSLMLVGFSSLRVCVSVCVCVCVFCVLYELCVHGGGAGLRLVGFCPFLLLTCA